MFDWTVFTVFCPLPLLDPFPHFTLTSISIWLLFHPHPFSSSPLFHPRPYFTFTLVWPSPLFPFHPLRLSILTKLLATRSKFIFRLICWILKSVQPLTPPTHSKDIAMTSVALPVEIREQVSSQSSPSNQSDQYGTDHSHNLIVILRHLAEVWEMKY